MAEEYLDIVTAANEVIGQRGRSLVHKSGLWHRGVHIFLFTSEHKLLIQQRSYQQDTFPLALDCSVSEHLKTGETYLEGALRGLREELNCGPIPLERLVQFRMNYGPGDNMINELYEGVIEASAARFDPNEIERIQLLTVHEAIKLLEDGHIPFSRWFVQLLYWYADRPNDLQILWSAERKASP